VRAPRYRNEEISLIEFAPPQPSRTLGIVRAKGKFLTPAARVFIDALHHLTSTRDPGKGRSASTKT